MATITQVKDFTIEGRHVTVGPNVAGIVTDGARFVVERPDEYYDTVDELIEAGVLVEVDGDHGEHVFVQGLAITDEERPAWAFQCNRHGTYGPIRFDYSDAVNDGHEHAGT